MASRARKVPRKRENSKESTSYTAKAMVEGFKKLFGGSTESLFDVNLEKKSPRRSFGAGKFGK